MKQSYETQSAKETQELGRLLAQELQGGEVIALSGNLGSGKTTFTQGMLKELGAEGPFTSPTFLIMKQYKLWETRNKKQETRNKVNQLQGTSFKIDTIYHFDAYRVGANDILNLGWKEIISDSRNVVIVEWADRVKNILPRGVLKINFKWLDEKKRRIGISSK